ncbi:helicase-exonuclease AddAB subunit AddA [Marasmitruncus massiliensis]|uniref:helicase-exonuclease AddAB subunit AddA n=1 Tax=Marasmitruncus massiliensis TaxID=1944642 RepID=UPI000C7A8A14|nr:helicase-exonuclease AddAB subunit AddA [Marasmitruncus massiliensis]
MADKQWTPQQRDAIEARGGTVLVSAAAGSGKTAVLVERVVGRILDPEDPVDADRLLVVTFSNAAALEMKQRIMARIAGLLAEHPDDANLRRQQLLLTRAQISTIHSFCLELIRSNFQQLGISANIRIADEKELDILRMDCAKESVERFHQQNQNGDFGRLTELLSSGRDDSKVFYTLFRLYQFVRSHPFYLDWLDRILLFYGDGVHVADSIWGTCILDYAGDALDYAAGLTRQALDVISGDEKMSAAYYDAFSHDLLQLEQTAALAAARDWDGICRKLEVFSFDKLGALRGEDPRKETVQALRTRVKTMVKSLREKQFCATAEEFAEDIAFLRPLVSLLFELVKDFDRTFTSAKQQKNLMDFSDMEHYAIALLVRPAGPGYAPTPLAHSISQLYDEVLIDEFQDTNAAQEMIFKSVSHKESNLFLVGDVKQSIYRFRQAMPELFMEKKKTYLPYNGSDFPAKIILGKNFRSSPEITGGINFFFSLLMSEKIGEIDYDEEEALIAGAKFPQGEQRGCNVCLLDMSDYTGEQDKTAIEADFVADRIAGLLESRRQVTQDGKLREIRPSDICVLLRSPAGKAQTYVNALNERGVPVWAEPKSGFLGTKEIAPVVALLRVIGNPLLDIDLAAAMMSALFGFTADEMAEIRIGQKRGPLYTAVCRHAESGNKHCAEFLAALRSLRQLAESAAADEVIRKIYEQTDYMGKVQAMRFGQARRSNLLLLVQYACDYHAGGYKGVSGFTGFLDRLLERGSDLSPAAGLSERADAVRIMSIHRSKGLEFPVVFLCDCAKQFNKEDLRSNTLLHSRLGFACMRRDFEKMIQFTTVPMQALRLELERSMLSEELRILYVALTRAKELLFLTGTAAKTEEKLSGLVYEPDSSGKLPSYQVRGAASYLDWILMAAVHHPDLEGVLAGCGVEASKIPADAPLSLEIVPISEKQPVCEALEDSEPAQPDADFEALLKRRLAFRYPYEAQTKIPTKLAVSQLAKGDMAKAYRFARRPAFLLEKGLTGAQRGNAMHKFMQFSDYHAAAADVQGELERMVSKGFLSREEADAVSAEKLKRFFESSLAKRIFASGQVWRELRFLAEAGRELLGEYTGIFDAEGKTAIQGVADCVFLENGGAIIVDYKTDYVKTAEELVQRYRIQLDLYRKVLGESLGLPVKECVLYSFSLSQEIVL